LLIDDYDENNLQNEEAYAKDHKTTSIKFGR
jgi:hypothetical protein